MELFLLYYLYIKQFAKSVRGGKKKKKKIKVMMQFTIAKI